MTSVRTSKERSNCSTHANPREHALHPQPFQTLRFQLLLFPYSQSYELLEEVGQRLTLLDQCKNLMIVDFRFPLSRFHRN